MEIDIGRDGLKFWTLDDELGHLVRQVGTAMKGLIRMLRDALFDAGDAYYSNLTATYKLWVYFSRNQTSSASLRSDAVRLLARSQKFEDSHEYF